MNTRLKNHIRAEFKMHFHGVSTRQTRCHLTVYQLLNTVSINLIKHNEGTYS